MCYVTELPPGEASDIALKHRLYVSGWTLSRLFQTYRSEPEKAKDYVRMFLAYKDNKPVGVLVYNKVYKHASIFVKKSMRRQGIGTTLINYALPNHGWTHSRGAKHTDNFGILLNQIKIIINENKMQEPITLSESSDQFKTIKEEWQQKARECTIGTLPRFLVELSEDYRHDYGTICHAMATNPDMVVRRSEVQELQFDGIIATTNRQEFLFCGEAPVTS